MSLSNSKDFVDRIEEWAHVIGVNLDRDPEQIM
jgi:hypothetical protein